jgi:acyl-CoA synthetase (AMP-forming)/AMP-acid ligase II
MMPDDASLVVAPLSHGAGIHLLVQVARAVKSILPASDRLDPDVAWSLVERWQVTNMFTVPTILKLLVEHSAVHDYDHSSLRTIVYAGAPMYREDQKTALRALGKVIVQYFGLGEVTGNITVLPPHLHEADDEALAGSCGYERTGMQISIQDADGTEVPAGETGEICVCGLAVFAGYYENDEANAKAFRDGWFRTGDLGHLDSAGYLFITGRASDMYISGGSNVYPREVEEKLLAHPALAEVAVVGMPDPIWGEIGVAAAVLRDGAAVDEAGLLAWIDGKVARYKIPRRIVFWDTLPKSAYGKVTKTLVRERLTLGEP